MFYILVDFGLKFLVLVIVLVVREINWFFCFVLREFFKLLIEFWKDFCCFIVFFVEMVNNMSDRNNFKIFVV